MTNVEEIAIPKFAIVNYNIARDGEGQIIFDQDGRIKFHAKMGPSQHALLLYSIRSTGESFCGELIYDALVAGPHYGSNRADDSQVAREASSNRADDDSPLAAPASSNEHYFEKQPEEILHGDKAKAKETPFDTHYLFYIHGFNSDPTAVFRSCQKYHNAHSRRIVIPVLWADEQAGIFGYLKDKLCNVQPAAHAFARLVDITYAFPQRSLVCHSMGNFLLRKLARFFAEQVKQGKKKGPHFDDIFMVAADVTDRLFDEHQNRSKDRTKNDGLCVLDLAKYNVHVLHSSKDLALVARLVPNGCSCALGFWGYNERRLCDAAKNKLVKRNCNPYNYSDCIHHSYVFEIEQMQYFEETLNERLDGTGE